MSGKKFDVFVQLGGGYGGYFSPVAVVKSDRSPIVSFEIKELIETFQAKVLQPITDLCEEHSLYLDHDWQW